MVFLAFFLIIIGIVATIFPYAGWYLSIGWKFRDAEPSDLALVMHRISGIVASVIGIIIVISSFSNFINQNSWEDRFKEKLVIDNVEFVSIGIGESPLFADEEKEILSLIREAEAFNRKDRSQSTAYYTSIEIGFEDGSRESILCLGSNFEISPSDVRDTTYMFTSEELYRWIEDWLQGEREDS